MELLNYWKLLKKYGNVVQVFFLIVGFALIFFFLIQTIKIFIEQPPFFFAFAVVNFFWSILGGIIVWKIFYKLKELEKNVRIKTELPIVSEKKDFANFFPSIFLIVNVIFFILSDPLKDNVGDVGLEAVFPILLVIIYFFIIAITVPLSIMAFLGKFKVGVNIIVTVILLPTTLFFLLSFIR